MTNTKEEIKKEIEAQQLEIREEFNEIKNQHTKRIIREYGKLVDIEEQRERDILSNINLNVKIIELKSKLEGYELAEKEILEIIDECRETSGFVGIVEWRDDYDLDLMFGCLDKLKQKIAGEK